MCVGVGVYVSVCGCMRVWCVVWVGVGVGVYVCVVRACVLVRASVFVSHGRRNVGCGCSCIGC